MKIAMHDLKSQYAAVREQVNARIQQVLDHGQYVMGPEVEELESRLAKLCGTGHSISCASGTEALLIALMALGVKAGDEVITTPFSFIATAEVIALLGAVPVFVDVHPDTCNLDPSRIEEAITPRTRAIMPVSLYGQVADMEEICAIAERHGIAVVEDAAQSFGARYKGRRSCALSTIGCTSFFPSKPLGCYGDGGAMFTDDPDLARAMREVRVHGQSRRYYHTRIGVGGRMDTIQCAVVLAKLDVFEDELVAREAVAARYDRLLAPLSDRVVLPTVRPDRNSVWAQYTIQVSDRAGAQEHLKAAGIPTSVHYPVPMHLQPAYVEHCVHGPLPVSERLAGTVLSLPMDAYIGAEQQEYVVERLAQAVAGSERPE